MIWQRQMEQNQDGINVGDAREQFVKWVSQERPVGDVQGN